MEDESIFGQIDNTEYNTFYEGGVTSSQILEFEDNSVQSTEESIVITSNPAQINSLRTNFITSRYEESRQETIDSFIMFGERDQINDDFYPELLLENYNNNSNFVVPGEQLSVVYTDNGKDGDGDEVVDGEILFYNPSVNAETLFHNTSSVLRSPERHSSSTHINSQEENDVIMTTTTFTNEPINMHSNLATLNNESNLTIQSVLLDWRLNLDTCEKRLHEVLKQIEKTSGSTKLDLFISLFKISDTIFSQLPKYTHKIQTILTTDSNFEGWHSAMIGAIQEGNVRSNYLSYIGENGVDLFYAEYQYLLGIQRTLFLECLSHCIKYARSSEVTVKYATETRIIVVNYQENFGSLMSGLENTIPVHTAILYDQYEKRRNLRDKMNRYIQDNLSDLDKSVSKKTKKISHKFTPKIRDLKVTIERLTQSRAKIERKYKRKNQMLFEVYLEKEESKNVKAIVSKHSISTYSQFISNGELFSELELKKFQKYIRSKRLKYLQQVKEIEESLSTKKSQLAKYTKEFIKDNSNLTTERNERTKFLYTKIDEEWRLELNEQVKENWKAFNTEDNLEQYRDFNHIDWLSGNFEVIQNAFSKFKKITDFIKIPLSSPPPPVNYVNFTQQNPSSFDQISTPTGVISSLEHQEWLNTIQDISPDKTDCLDYFAYMVKTNSRFRDLYYDPTAIRCGGLNFVADILKELKEGEHNSNNETENKSVYFVHWLWLTASASRKDEFYSKISLKENENHLGLPNSFSGSTNYFSRNPVTRPTGIENVLRYTENWKSDKTNLIPNGKTFSACHKGLICNTLSEAILVNDLILLELEYKLRQEGIEEYQSLRTSDKYVYYERHLKSYSVPIHSVLSFTITRFGIEDNFYVDLMDLNTNGDLTNNIDSKKKSNCWISSHAWHTQEFYGSLLQLLVDCGLLYGEGKYYRKRVEKLKKIDSEKAFPLRQNYGVRDCIDRIKKLNDEFSSFLSEKDLGSHRYQILKFDLYLNLISRRKELFWWKQNLVLKKEMLSFATNFPGIVSTEVTKQQENTLNDFLNQLQILDEKYFKDQIKLYDSFVWSKFKPLSSYNYKDFSYVNFKSKDWSLSSTSDVTSKEVLETLKTTHQMRLENLIIQLNDEMAKSLEIIEYCMKTKTRFIFSKGFPYTKKTSNSTRFGGDGGNDGGDFNSVFGSDNGNMNYSEDQLITLYCFGNSSNYSKLHVGTNDNVNNTSPLLYTVTMAAKYCLCIMNIDEYESETKRSFFRHDPKNNVFENISQTLDHLKILAEIERGFHGENIYSNTILSPETKKQMFKNLIYTQLRWVGLELVVINQTNYKHKESFWLKNNTNNRDFEVYEKSHNNPFSGLYVPIYNEVGDFASSVLDNCDYNNGHLIGLAFVIHVCMFSLPLGIRFEKENFTSVSASFYDEKYIKSSKSRKVKETHTMLGAFDPQIKLEIQKKNITKPYASFKFLEAAIENDSLFGPFALTADHWVPYRTKTVGKFGFNLKKSPIGHPAIPFQDALDFTSEEIANAKQNEIDLEEFLRSSLYNQLLYYNEQYDCMRVSPTFKARLLKKIESEEILWRSVGCIKEFGERPKDISKNSRDGSFINPRILENFESRKLSSGNESFIQQVTFLALKRDFSKWKNIGYKKLIKMEEMQKKKLGNSNLNVDVRISNNVEHDAIRKEDDCKSWMANNNEDTAVAYPGFFPQLFGIKDSPSHLMSFVTSTLRLLFSSGLTNGSLFSQERKLEIISEEEIRLEVPSSSLVNPGVIESNAKKLYVYSLVGIKGGRSYEINYDTHNVSNSTPSKGAKNIEYPQSLSNHIKSTVIPNFRMQKQTLLVLDHLFTKGGYQRQFDYKGLGFGGILRVDVSNEGSSEGKSPLKQYSDNIGKIYKKEAQTKKFMKEMGSTMILKDKKNNVQAYDRLASLLDGGERENDFVVPGFRFTQSRNILNFSMDSIPEIFIIPKLVSLETKIIGSTNLEMSYKRILHQLVNSFYDTEGIFNRYSLCLIDTIESRFLSTSGANKNSGRNTSGSSGTQHKGAILQRPTRDVKWNHKFKNINIIEKWKQGIASTFTNSVVSNVGEPETKVAYVSQLAGTAGSCFFNQYPNSTLNCKLQITDTNDRGSELTFTEGEFSKNFWSRDTSYYHMNPIQIWDYLLASLNFYPHYLQYDAVGKGEWTFNTGNADRKSQNGKVYSALGLIEIGINNNKESPVIPSNLVFKTEEEIRKFMTNWNLGYELTAKRISLQRVLRERESRPIQPEHRVCYYAHLFIMRQDCVVDRGDSIKDYVSNPWGNVSSIRNNIFYFYQEFIKDMSKKNDRKWNELMAKLNSNNNMNNDLPLTTKHNLAKYYKRWLISKLGWKIIGNQGNILLGLERRSNVKRDGSTLLLTKEILDVVESRTKYVSPLGLSPIHKWKKNPKKIPDCVKSIESPEVDLDKFIKDFSMKDLEHPSKTAIDVLQTTFALCRINLSKSSKSLYKTQQRYEKIPPEQISSEEITDFCIKLQEHNLTYNICCVVKSLYERYCLQQIWCNILETKYIQEGKIKYSPHYRVNDAKLQRDIKNIIVDPEKPITHTIHIIREYHYVNQEYSDYELILPYDCHLTERDPEQMADKYVDPILRRIENKIESLKKSKSYNRNNGEPLDKSRNGGINNINGETDEDSEHPVNLDTVRTSLGIRYPLNLLHEKFQSLRKCGDVSIFGFNLQKLSVKDNVVQGNFSSN